MTLARRSWAYALFLWLSLATVVVPAVGWSGSPLARPHGSAFSAFTSDVSLGPRRAAPPEKAKQYQNGADGADGDALQIGAALLRPKSLIVALRRVTAGTAFPLSAQVPPPRLADISFQARAPPLP